MMGRMLGWCWSRPSGPMQLLDFQDFCADGCNKRALVSYLVSPLLPRQAERDRVKFSSDGIAQQIPKALNELGYVTDIVQWDSTHWQPSRRYDLFIGHGGINFEQISRQLPPSAARIYFSSGIYWREYNSREVARLYDLAHRRGYLLPPDRPILYSEEQATRLADGIICLGNEMAVRTYRGFPKILGINNAAYPVAWSDWQYKDHDQGRVRFLFFSGEGSIHKGLDLLLEAFAGTALHLHICQNLSPGFAQIYAHELTELPNIHLHGRLPMRSSEFHSLASACTWVISATCAEGQPGAVLECMAHGLIPILPDTANIDLGDFGLRLPDCEVETIRDVIQVAAHTPVDECRRRAHATWDVMQRDYTPENFNRSFKLAVQEIVAAAARTASVPAPASHGHIPPTC
jgi:glycosyltransferase involved in cell wall biosynthesis